jgi:hypothetical protein
MVTMVTTHKVLKAVQSEHVKVQLYINLNWFIPVYHYIVIHTMYSYYIMHFISSTEIRE